MLFNSLTFVVFFAVVVTRTGASAPGMRARICSWSRATFFTAPGIRRSPRFFFPPPRWIFGSAGKLPKPRTSVSRRGWLVASVCMNLSMLGFFKYGNFLLENFQWLLARIGVIYQPPHLDIFLPVGISFYTFHSLSYTLDIYRGVLQPTRSLRDFVLAVSFFPQLVAGPIVRAGDFLPQLVRPPRLRTGQFLWGLVADDARLVRKNCARRHAARRFGRSRFSVTPARSSRSIPGSA